MKVVEVSGEKGTSLLCIRPFFSLVFDLNFELPEMIK